MASKRKVISVKGQTVDFDLLKIKNQIVQSPKSNDVVAREKFIDKRRRRTNRTTGTERKTSEMLAQQEQSKALAQEAIKQQMEAHDRHMQEVIDHPQQELNLSSKGVEQKDLLPETNVQNKFERKIVK